MKFIVVSMLILLTACASDLDKMENSTTTVDFNANPTITMTPTTVTTIPKIIVIQPTTTTTTTTTTIPTTTTTTEKWNIPATITTTEPRPTFTTTTSPPRDDHPLTANTQAPVTTEEPVAQEVSSGGVWDRLAECESGGDWSINTGNGYYGGLQFALQSWQAVGGTGYPHEHSREEQIRRAEILLEMQGWGAWPTCSRKIGLR
ncbi:MAG: transglycosylase family protein [Paenisporosarcina sp.]